MSIDDIKTLLKSGDIAGAEAAAQELLAAEPDNVQAMMFYGTCRQLQGDEATFRRIHDELAPRITKSKDVEALEMWKHFDELCQGADGPFLALDAEVVDNGFGSATLYSCGSFVGGTVALREEDAINFLYGCRPCVSPRVIKRRGMYVLFAAVLVVTGLMWLAWWLGRVL